jgi:hypothetical protein
MNIKVEVWDNLPQLGDARNPSKKVISISANISIEYIPGKTFKDSKEWKKFYNMIKDTYSGYMIEIHFYEEKRISDRISTITN